MYVVIPFDFSNTLPLREQDTKRTISSAHMCSQCALMHTLRTHLPRTEQTHKW